MRVLLGLTAGLIACALAPAGAQAGEPHHHPGTPCQNGNPTDLCGHGNDDQIIRVEVEDPGGNCPAGGVVIIVSHRLAPEPKAAAAGNPPPEPPKEEPPATVEEFFFVCNGIDGEDGEPGPPGPPGPPGQDGADGAPGADGQDGADGAPGADGLPGEPGPQGDEGPRGPAGRVSDCVFPRNASMRLPGRYQGLVGTRVRVVIAGDIQRPTIRERAGRAVIRIRTRGLDCGTFPIVVCSIGGRTASGRRIRTAIRIWTLRESGRIVRENVGGPGWRVGGQA